MAGGTYTLLVELPVSIEIEIGVLGRRSLDPGWYAYTGSALGAGGFARVERHRELSAGDRDTRHWHVDYLLGHSVTELRDVVTTPDVDVECAVASRLPDGPVSGFGASDCDCRSHLAAGTDSIRAAVVATHRQARAADVT